MNFFLYQNAISFLDKASYAVDLLTFIASAKWEKKHFSPLMLAGISDQALLGYTMKPKEFPFDLLFTKTAQKEIQPYLSPAITKTFLDIAYNDFSRGGRLRNQGEMKSITIPGTRQQNVLLFVSMMMKTRGVQLIVGVDKASNWNKHGKAMDKKNDYSKKASNRKYTYQKVCERCLEYLKKIFF